MKKFIFTILFLGLAACSGKNDDAGEVTPVESKSIGPFSIEFPDGQNYQQKVSAAVAQNEGKIDFFAYSDQAYQIVVKDLKLTVTGCEASQVKFTLLWIPNIDQAPAMGLVVQKSSRFLVAAKTKGSVVASFENLQNCTNIDFDLSLLKIPYPVTTYGNWTSNYMAPTDPTHSMRLDISQLSTSVQGVFQITCDNFNTEKFTTEMVANSEAEAPQKMAFRITSVNQQALSTCSKQFGVKPSDVGLTIYCIHNRAGAYSVFNLVCRLGTGYPSNYAETTTTWQKN